ncbi:hypothetical protein ILUMI_05294 [Ignelater luminosus]|uniref:SCAN domain-containing protein n=1 Tax=Ignelater luminosus TaxID=2038154 RepID=A0A8K0DAS5_IGNLU|nr:hypothetical protein ILUMI_05294 [Ignelater luminosus]
MLRSHNILYTLVNKEDREKLEETMTQDVDVSSTSKQIPQSQEAVIAEPRQESTHACYKCNILVHVICGETQSEEEGNKLPCAISKIQFDQNKQREEAKESLEIQAKKMLVVSDLSHPTADKGDTARIKVPDVDRVKTDAVQFWLLFLIKRILQIGH